MLFIGVLAGGTGAGHIAMFKFSSTPALTGVQQEPEDQWKLQPPCTVSGPISDIVVSERGSVWYVIVIVVVVVVVVVGVVVAINVFYLFL